MLYFLLLGVNVVNPLQTVWSAIVNHLVLKNNHTKLWTLHDNIPWSANTTALYYRDCYGTLLTSLQGIKKALIYGTPGIGKTMFLFVLMVHIVETAKAKKKVT